MSGVGSIGGGQSIQLDQDISYLKWRVEGAERDLEYAKQRLREAEEKANERRLQRNPNVDSRDQGEQSGESVSLDPS